MPQGSQCRRYALHGFLERSAIAVILGRLECPSRVMLALGWLQRAPVSYFQHQYTRLRILAFHLFLNNSSSPDYPEEVNKSFRIDFLLDSPLRPVLSRDFGRNGSIAIRSIRFGKSQEHFGPLRQIRMSYCTPCFLRLKSNM